MGKGEVLAGILMLLACEVWAEDERVRKKTGKNGAERLEKEQDITMS